MSMFQRKPLLAKATDQLKNLKRQLEGVVECENDVARALLKWSYEEENRNLGVVFSCLADLTYGYAILIEELCKKHVTYRQVFKNIIEEENELERIKDEKIRCEGKVSNAHKKVENQVQKSKRDETKVQIAQAELQEAVKRSSEATSLYETKLEEFELSKAKSIRNALIDHNNCYIETLYNMQIIFQTKKTIAETMSETPLYTAEENVIVDDHRLVNETLENMGLSVPTRESTLDRHQINRAKKPVRSASPSRNTISSFISPPSSPKARRPVPSPLVLTRPSQTVSHKPHPTSPEHRVKKPPPAGPPPARPPPTRPPPQLMSSVAEQLRKSLDSDDSDSDDHDYTYPDEPLTYQGYKSATATYGTEIDGTEVTNAVYTQPLRMPPGHEMTRLPPGSGPLEYLEPKQNISTLPPSPVNNNEQEPFYWAPPSEEVVGVENAERRQSSDGGRVTKHAKPPKPITRPKTKPRTGVIKAKHNDTSDHDKVVEDEIYAISQVSSPGYK